MSEKSPERLVSVREACTYGNFSRSKLYEKMNDKTIKAYRREGRTLIDLDTIDVYKAKLSDWTPPDKSRQPGN